MKKIIATLLSLLTISVSGGLLACNEANDASTKSDGKESSSSQRPECIYNERSVAATCKEKAHTIYTCPDCGHSYVDDYTGDLKAHTGIKNCSVCNVSFFDLAKSLINENGTEGTDKYTLTITSADLTAKDMTLTCHYTPSTNEMYAKILCDEFSFSLHLTSQLNAESYSWSFFDLSQGSSTSKFLLGSVDATKFEQTTILESSVSGYASSVTPSAEQVAHILFISMLDAIEEALSGTQLSISNFGFTKYE